MYLGTVHNGAVTYRVATMEKQPAVGQAVPAVRQTPYALVGEDGVNYAGPHRGDVPPGRCA